jgi:hypothetical protein
MKTRRLGGVKMSGSEEMQLSPNLVERLSRFRLEVIPSCDNFFSVKQ